MRAVAKQLHQQNSIRYRSELAPLEFLHAGYAVSVEYHAPLGPNNDYCTLEYSEYFGPGFHIDEASQTGPVRYIFPNQGRAALVDTFVFFDAVNFHFCF